MDDEAPDYRNVVHNPMDVATLLQRVDSGHYLTRSTFLKDVDLIPANAQVLIILPLLIDLDEHSLLISLFFLACKLDCIFAFLDSTLTG